MYQIKGQQVSFRVTDFERDELNQVAETLQTKNEVEYSNGKDLTFGILTEMKKLQTAEPKTVEVEVEVEKEVTVEVLPEALKTKFAEIKENIFDGEELSEEEMLDTLIQIVNTPAPVVPQVEEKIIQVERKLSENEVLVELKTAQIEALNFIADYRFKKKLDAEKILNNYISIKELYAGAEFIHAEARQPELRLKLIDVYSELTDTDYLFEED